VPYRYYSSVRAPSYIHHYIQQLHTETISVIYLIHGTTFIISLLCCYYLTVIMTAHAGSLPAILLLQQRRDNPPAHRPNSPPFGLGALLGIQGGGDPTWGHPYGRAPLGIMPPHWIILRKNSSKRYFWDNRKTKLNKIDGYYILVPGVVRGLSEATLQPSLHSILPGRSRLAILQ
jgi:hypothetical protein